MIAYDLRKFVDNIEEELLNYNKKFCKLVSVKKSYRRFATVLKSNGLVANTP